MNTSSNLMDNQHIMLNMEEMSTSSSQNSWKELMLIIPIEPCPQEPNISLKLNRISIKIDRTHYTRIKSNILHTSAFNKVQEQFLIYINLICSNESIHFSIQKNNNQSILESVTRIHISAVPQSDPTI